MSKEKKEVTISEQVIRVRIGVLVAVVLALVNMVFIGPMSWALRGWMKQQTQNQKEVVQQVDDLEDKVADYYTIIHQRFATKNTLNDTRDDIIRQVDLLSERVDNLTLSSLQQDQCSTPQ